MDKQDKHERLLDKLGNMAKVQKHQLNDASNQLGAIDNKMAELEADQNALNEVLASALGDAQSLLERDNSISDETQKMEPAEQFEIGLHEIEQLEQVDYVEANADSSWDDIVAATHSYAQRHSIDLKEDPFKDLMSFSQRIEFEKWLKADFTYRNAKCDKYDYLIAATCGLLGGLIDIFFVIAPGEGGLGSFTDKMTDKAVEKFAGLNGWNGPREGANPTASAIGFLERNFKVNYDQRHGGDVDRLFKMSTKNHHIKSLSHSPDLIGLFFSILNQFTSTSTFISDGHLITIETETFDLQGANFVSKIFCGVFNWLGHLFSDVAGSSGAVGRGAGIPIPFYSMLQFVNVGEFGQYRQSFATIAVQVFEKGYDIRHGAAMAIPVVITELLTRLMWSVKQHYYRKKDWSDCIPDISNPELRRMLVVSHGTLCLVDTADATIRSGGTVIGFMLHSNIIEMARFGILAAKEVRAWYLQGSIDSEKIDAYIDNELQRMC